jgi:flagellar basal-body rod protein FlgB
MDSLRLKIPSNGVGMKSEVEEGFGGKALQFRGKRQALLAANLANADTPNFKALDVSFAESLREAAKNGNALHAATPPLKATSQRHFGPVTLGGQDTLAFARFATPAQPRLDGGTVDMDVERGNFMQNVILYQMAMVSLGDELEEFKTAAADPRR